MSDPGFEEFWKIYPKKVDRGHATKAYRRALKLASADVILAGARRYAEQQQQLGVEEKHIKGPVGWLEGLRWLDETKPPGSLTAAPFRQTAKRHQQPTAQEIASEWLDQADR